jgi:hypothetical protein
LPPRPGARSPAPALRRSKGAHRRSGGVILRCTNAGLTGIKDRADKGARQMLLCLKIRLADSLIVQGEKK